MLKIKGRKIRPSLPKQKGNTLPWMMLWFTPPFFSPQSLLNWINPAYLFTSKIAQVTQVTNKFKGTDFEWFWSRFSRIGPCPEKSWIFMMMTTLLTESFQYGPQRALFNPRLTIRTRSKWYRDSTIAIQIRLSDIWKENLTCSLVLKSNDHTDFQGNLSRFSASTSLYWSLDCI